MWCFSKISTFVMFHAVLQGRFQLFSGSISFSPINTDNGQWIFEEGENVTLNCTIIPYSIANHQNWKFNSTSIISRCDFNLCAVSNNNSGIFTFHQNTIIGEFFWFIYPMPLEYNNAQFECSDGSDSLRYNATVLERPTVADTPCRSCGLGTIIIICFDTAEVLLIVVFFIGLLYSKDGCFQSIILPRILSLVFVILCFTSVIMMGIYRLECVKELSQQITCGNILAIMLGSLGFAGIVLNIYLVKKERTCEAVLTCCCVICDCIRLFCTCYKKVDPGNQNTETKENTNKADNPNEGGSTTLLVIQQDRHAHATKDNPNPAKNLVVAAQTPKKKNTKKRHPYADSNVLTKNRENNKTADNTSGTVLAENGKETLAKPDLQNTTDIEWTIPLSVGTSF